MEVAVRLSGYSRAHLRRLLRSGKLRNVGTPDEPEFLASSLPRKAAKSNKIEILAPGQSHPVYFSKQVARAIVRGRNDDGD
jgi:hypothetical protein